MRRRFLGSVLVLLGLSFAAHAQPITRSGDLNGDGDVNAGDLAAMIGVLSGETRDPATIVRADLNRDGRRDELDLLGVLQLVGREGSCPDVDNCCRILYPLGCCFTTLNSFCKAEENPPPQGGDPTDTGSGGGGEVGGGDPGDPPGGNEPDPPDDGDDDRGPCDFYFAVKDAENKFHMIGDAIPYPLEAVGAVIIWTVRDENTTVSTSWEIRKPDGSNQTGSGISVTVGGAPGRYTVAFTRSTDDGDCDERVIDVYLYDMRPGAITFGGGNHIIRPDDPASADPPNQPFIEDQWLDFNGDGTTDDPITEPNPHNYTRERRLPVAYTRNTAMTISEFEPWVDTGEAAQLMTGPNPAPAAFVFRAIHDDPGGGDPVTFFGAYPGTPAVADSPLADMIAHLPAYILRWEVSFDGEHLWFSIGQTSHEVYVTLDDPDKATLMAESVFQIGCSSAAGTSDALGACIGVFSEFGDLDVRTAPGGNRMGYYADGENDSTQVTRASGLLLSPYNGQCGAWAELLLHCFWLHGLNPSIVEVNVDTDELPPHCGVFDAAPWMLIKNYIFGGSATSGCAGWPYRIDIPALSPDPWLATTTECTPWLGVPGQGSLNPRSAFVRHYVVRLEPTPNLQLYFDPSYGQGPFLGSDDWQLSSVAGFARRIVTPAMPGAEPAAARPSLNLDGIKFEE